MLVRFCSKCGEKLPEDAYFCPKCGVKTRRGAEAGVTTPLDELGQAFSRMGQEMEKAFSKAADEIHGAFKTARKNVRESTGGQVVCKNCKEKNPVDAVFCHSCGEKLDEKE
jgi:ribosomal protein L40E